MEPSRFAGAARVAQEDSDTTGQKFAVLAVSQLVRSLLVPGRSSWLDLLTAPDTRYARMQPNVCTDVGQWHEPAVRLNELRLLPCGGQEGAETQTQRHLAQNSHCQTGRR